MVACWLFFLFSFVHSRCHVNDIFDAEALLEKTRYTECHMLENPQHAGTARNVTAQCKQDKQLEHPFYYQISWEHPEYTGVSVTGYRVYIMYSTMAYACFQLPASENSFVFNKSIGLAYGCSFHFSVTPQPISFIDESNHTPLYLVSGCPVEIKLLPLPNIFIQPSSSFSFTAIFREEPIPSARLVWYFSSDRKFCSDRQRIKEDKHEVVFLKNNQVLKIARASKKHSGCYIVTAENGIGDTQEQRGYLGLNMTRPFLSKSQRKHRANIEGTVFATTAALLVAMIMVTVVLMFKWKRRSSSERQMEKEQLLKNKVYISHCMHEHTENVLLLKFASALKKCDLDVFIDICSTVEINNAGDVLRWIPLKMKAANKIVVIATQYYVRKLQPTPESDNDQNYEKVLTEIHMIRKMMKDKSKNSENVLVVCLGVDKNDLLYPINTSNTIQFPGSSDFEQDAHFKDVIQFLKGT